MASKLQCRTAVSPTATVVVLQINSTELVSGLTSSCFRSTVHNTQPRVEKKEIHPHSRPLLCHVYVGLKAILLKLWGICKPICFRKLQTLRTLKT